jgi:serine/threonine protein kinase
MTISAGARVGSYEILVAIGAGGMGEVYRARRVVRDGLLIIPSLG